MPREAGAQGRQFRLRKGLDLPIAGAPQQTIEAGGEVDTVGLLGADYLGLKPRVFVSEGDAVAAGTAIFAHKDTPSAPVTSPVAGVVRAINRGARRKLESIEIEVDAGAQAPVDFSRVGDLNTVDGLVERLCAAGFWGAFRTRPYSKVPATDTRPAALYVTGMESDPGAPDAAVVIADAREAFVDGLQALAALPTGKTYLCHAVGANPLSQRLAGIEAVGFAGPHPAGLPGTHLHFLEPPTARRVVWTVGYQDVIAIGRLLQTGHVHGERIIALNGPRCARPRLLRTISGASMTQLTTGEISGPDPVRLISGSVLSGIAGEGHTAYLGRYARQLTVIEEDRRQTAFGWITPMASKFAVQPVLGSAFSRKRFDLTSNLNGGRRAMVPVGTFEELMPQDYLPTQLLRALLVKDTDMAQALGVLELDEEDLGLVGFACPAKYEYGVALRDCLDKIEKEG